MIPSSSIRFHSSQHPASKSLRKESTVIEKRIITPIVTPLLLVHSSLVFKRILKSSKEQHSISCSLTSESSQIFSRKMTENS